MSEQHTLDQHSQEQLTVFIERCFNEIVQGEQYLHNWHIDAIAWQLERCFAGVCRRLIITMPPRHLKSICASVTFPAWALGLDPTRKIVCASYSHELARQHAIHFRRVIESPWYQRLFRRMRTRRVTDGEITTTHSGYRRAVSVEGTLTGIGGNIFIIDDPLNAADALSGPARERVRNWYDGTLYSRLNNPNEDVIILVMQRLHEDDLVGHVKAQEDWEHLNLPAIAAEDEDIPVGQDETYPRNRGDLLHGERMDEAALERTRRTMGTLFFQAQYLQTPVPAEGNMIQWSWFRRYGECPPREEFDMVVQSWDTAIEVGDNNDYSVCTTWGVRGEDIYLIDVFRNRLQYTDLRHKIMELRARHNPHHVLMELSVSGYALVQEFWRYPNRRLTPVRPVRDKLVRMAAQTPKIEAGRVHLPAQAPWLNDLQQELLAFPSGRHDDQVDSISQFLYFLERLQSRQRPTERRSVGRRRAIQRR